MGKIFGSLIALLAVAVALVFLFAWRTPPLYPEAAESNAYALMPWADYESAAQDVEPPLVLKVDPLLNGAALFYGPGHGHPPGDPVYTRMEEEWRAFKPTVAMLEGRMGFLLPPLMDPVGTFYESGKLAALAKADGLTLYSWELSKAGEIAALFKTHEKEQVALFIILRPYSGRGSSADKEAANKVAAMLIRERGGRPGIEGAITSVADIDRIWARDFPSDGDWRDFNFGPQSPGYLGVLFEQANNVRDEHMLNAVHALAAQGERVFVTAGWSHVLRIEPVFAGHGAEIE